MKRKWLTVGGLIFLLFSFGVKAQAPEQIWEGKVVRVTQETIIQQDNQKTTRQHLEVELLEGAKKGQQVEVRLEEGLLKGQVPVKKGDVVLLSLDSTPTGKQVYYLVDFVRRPFLGLLLTVFLLLTLLVGGWQGATSLLGLLISFLAVIYFLVPKIAAGWDPILVTGITSLLIVPATFYLSHGFNRKTTVAIGGTIIALLVTSFLSHAAVYAAKLTGLVSEEAGFLQAAKPGFFNPRGLLLAGMIIGTLGVLDDVTVSQAAVVSQLRAVNRQLSFQELWWRAMRVGRDHIASMVNTLILVYAGAALPLLLLFYQNPHPLSQIINYEIVAEEVVRALVGSIGLILAVPFTTLIAAASFSAPSKAS